MNDNNALAVAKLQLASKAIDTGIPAAEKLGLRFCEVIEKQNGNWAAIIQTETNARYAAIKDGNEANVGAMLANEKELGLAAFGFLDKLFSKGLGLAEKAMDLEAMWEAGRAPERAAHIASVEMETRLAERKLAIAEKEAEARMMEAKARLSGS